MTSRPVRVFRWLLAATATIAALALLVRAWWGPFVFGLSVRSPMNAESILAAAVMLLLLSSADLRGTVAGQGSTRLAVTLVIAGTALGCWPSLWVGFVADDYAHILTVSKAGASYIRDVFTVPAADRFFRPLAMLSYLFDVQWAGFSPVRWHLAGLLLHAANSALVTLLARRLGLPAVWAAVAGLLFGLHGTRPEAVTWVAARFDLLATLFALSALLLFLRYVRSPSAAGLAAFLAATVAGLLSKESAYVLPLLCATLAAFHRGVRNPAGYRATAACALLTAGVFAYRWWLLGGVGGYHDPHGTPTILYVNLWLLIKALVLRLWAVLLFPLNWTDPLGLPVKAALAAAIAALLFLAARAKAARAVQLGAALVLVASLPVYHLLLIGPDLEKSRVVYLGSAAFAFLMAAALRTLPRNAALASAVAILAFNTAALRHNLATWDRVSRIHAAACDAIGSAATQGPVLAVGMPNTHDGVYMLKTGLPECVEIRHGVPASRVRLVPDLPAQIPAGAAVLVWDEHAAQVRRVR